MPNSKSRFLSVNFDKLLLFIVWPFGSLWYALFHVANVQSKTLVWLFCVFIGLGFIIPDEIVGTADSSRIAAQFESIHEDQLSFDGVLHLLYNPRYGVADIYQLLVSWIVAIFTGNPQILFAVFAAVFGYFYVQSIWIILDKIEYRLSYPVIFLVVAFALINPIWNINGVRMYTATQILIYGLLKIYISGNKNGRLWVLITPLIHFSFLFPVVIILGYVFIPFKKSITSTPILFFFFLFGASLVEIDLPFLRNALLSLPDIFTEKVYSYTNTDYSIARSERLQYYAWHVKFASSSFKYVNVILISIIYLNRKKWGLKNQFLVELFNLALLFGGISLILSSVPSFGRFLTVMNLMFYAVIITVFARYNFKVMHMRLFKITLPFILFYIVFQIRTGMDYASILTFIGNPVLVLFFDAKVPVIDFIKQLL